MQRNVDDILKFVYKIFYVETIAMLFKGKFDL